MLVSDNYHERELTTVRTLNGTIEPIAWIDTNGVYVCVSRYRIKLTRSQREKHLFEVIENRHQNIPDFFVGLLNNRRPAMADDVRSMICFQYESIDARSVMRSMKSETDRWLTYRTSFSSCSPMMKLFQCFLYTSVSLKIAETEKRWKNPSGSAELV